MPFTLEEIKNLEALLLSPIEENVKIAFAILEGKEYPDEIKILLEEYQEFYKSFYLNDSNRQVDLEEICLNINHDIQIDRNSQEVGLFNKITYLYYFSDKEKALPEILKKLAYLEELHLNCTLTNQNLDFLAYFSQLKILLLDSCEINHIPSIVRKLTKLERLDLGHNDLSQADFISLANLKELKILCLDYCELTDLPNELENLTYLESLNLDGNDLSQANFTVLVQLKNLKELNLEFCKITNLSISLKKLIGLDSLDLMGNNLSQADFTGLASLKKLKYLRLDCCKLTHLPPVLIALQNKGVIIDIETD